MDTRSVMTAAVMTGHGGASTLEVRPDVPVPVPADGEVLVRVSAAAVNNTDLWTREGAYGRPGDPDAVAGWRGVPIEVPRIQGADVVGTVVEVTPGVDERLAGRRVLLDPARHGTDGPEPELVAVMGSEFDGGFAELVAVDASHVHDVEESPLADAELACLPIAYGTAMGMLDRAELRAGETVLVTGASGAVGTALVQLAVARAARVVAVTSARHADAVVEAGAAAVVDRGAPDVRGAVREAADGPLDVVADVVGGWVAETLLDSLRTGGRWVTCGAIAGPVVTLDLRQLYLRQRRLIGSTMHTPEQFARLVQQARGGGLAPRVERSYPLEEIHEAQAHFRDASCRGRIVLVPG